MKRNYIILLVILLIACFLRFYNLLFDAPYFFNPDERNMANAITQLRLPLDLRQLPSCFQNKLNASPLTLDACNLNPHFFAYGQFPLYLAYFSDYSSKIVINIFHNSFIPDTKYQIRNTSFGDAVFWLRFWSALASTLTVLLVFKVTKKLLSDKDDPCQLTAALLSTTFAAFSPGLIQSAHFGTTESLLTFFFILVIYLSILFLSKKLYALRFTLYASCILGLSLSTKISALIFLPILLLAIFLSKIKLHKKFLFSFLILTSSFLILGLTSPYNILEQNSFLGTLNYESSVALGHIKVFYTRQFENTTPILFQAQNIFPYTLGLPIFISGILGFFLIILKSILYLVYRISNNPLPNTKYQIRNTIIIFAFLIYFLPNAFLYAKWTRFMTPVLPLFSVFGGYLLYQLSSKSKAQMSIRQLADQSSNVKKRNILSFGFCHLKLICHLDFVIWILLVICILPGLTFFTIYLRPDTRVSASKWIYENISPDSYVLSETANVVDIPVPLSSTIYHPPSAVISFNFYDLDENPDRFEELLVHLKKADYIFVPSRRIFANSLRLPIKYPLTAKYYNLLFSGQLGFTKIFETNSPGRWPDFAGRSPNFVGRRPDGLLPGGIDEQAEETFTVFDHPVVRIYKKTSEITREEYRKLLTD